MKSQYSTELLKRKKTENYTRENRYEKKHKKFLKSVLHFILFELIWHPERSNTSDVYWSSNKAVFVTILRI